MNGLGKILRERARSLGLSDSEVARRLGLSQARYHNYVADVAEPDLGTLVRICGVLGTSPNEVLSPGDAVGARTAAEIARERIASAAAALDGDALAYTADLIEAMLMVQRGRTRKPGARSQVMNTAKTGNESQPSVTVTGTKRRPTKPTR